MSLHEKTYRHHVKYMALRGPAIALSMQFASFIAVKSLGAPEEQAILIMLAMPMGNLLAFLYPKLLGRRARVPFAFWPDFVGFLILLPMVFVTRPEVFIGMIFATVLLRASTIVALSGIMRENYAPATRAATMGKVQSASLGVMAGSGVLFGWILEQDHMAYRYLFPLCSVAGMFALWQLRKIPEEDPAARPTGSAPRFRDFFQILRSNGHFRRYQISFFVFGFAAWMFNTLLPLYLAQDLKADYRSGALILVVINFGLPFLTSPFWGRVIDRTNLLLMRGAFNLAWSFAPLLVFLTHSVAGVIVAQLIAGFILGGSRLIWNLGVNIFAKRDEVPTYMGLHQSLTGIRGLLAPIIGLQLAELFAAPGAVPNYRAVFLICWGLTIVAGGFMIWEAFSMQRRGVATTFAQAEREEG